MIHTNRGGRGEAGKGKPKGKGGGREREGGWKGERRMEARGERTKEGG